MSENKSWVDWWKSKDWIELSSHGHYHKVFKYTFEEIGEQEFLELSYHEAKDRVKDIINEWTSVGVSPKGFKDFDRWSEELFEQESRELKNRKQFVSIEVDWANRGVKARVKRNVKRMERAKQLKIKLEKDEASYRKAVASVKVQALKSSSDNSKFIAEFN